MHFNDISADICAIRLDFETFVTLGPNNNQEGGGAASLLATYTATTLTNHLCTDQLTASVVI